MILVLLTAPIVAAACGSSDSAASAADQLVIKKGSVGACLLRAGAKRATTTGDLDFLGESESNDEVAKVAFAFDRSGSIFVNIWTATPRNGHPPGWVVWFAQPFNKDLSPMEIVEIGQADGYVMFLNRPTRVERKRAAACIKLGSGKGGISHPLG